LILEKLMVMKLSVVLLATVALTSTTAVFAKGKPEKAAGPEPTITVATDCVRLVDGIEVNKYYAEGSPSMKNELLVQAMAVADFQVTCDGPSVIKDYCVVSRTTPSGVWHSVYETESACE
jgi:hypothetical protein